MPHFGKTLSELLEISPISIEEFASRIGCQVPNIYKLKKKESVDIRMMEAVSRALEVNPMIFIDPELLRNEIPDSKPIYKNQALLGKAIMNIGWKEDVRNLKEKLEVKLEEKERLIAEKERLIQLLLNGKGNLNLV